MAPIRSLVRGVAMGIVAGVLVFAVALLSGLAASGSRLVFLAAAVAAGVFGLLVRGQRRLEFVGALIVGAGALASGLISGWGWLEYSVVVGSVLGAVWLVTGEQMPGIWGWFRWGGLVLLLLVFLLLPLILNGGTLGHDEAAYAVKARSWLEGTPSTGWAVHRGIAMSAYGYLVLAMGGEEAGLRLIGLGAALVLVIGVWLLARDMASTRVAAVASVAVIAGPAVLMRSTEYLSDVPSAALLVLCMVVAWREFELRDLPTYRLLWILPMAWTAFYLRYQSILSLALIGLVVVVLWWPKVTRRPGPVLTLAAVGLFGLFPHAVQAISITGTPWGILTFTSAVAGRAYLGEGIVDYLRLARWALAGFVGPIVMLAAVVGLVARWGELADRRRYLFLLLPAVLQILVLGAILHGEARFIFFPLALVVVAGCIAIDAWIGILGSRMRHAATWFLVVVLVGSVAISAAAVRRSVDYRATVNAPVEAAGLTVAAAAEGASCGVLTSYVPQVTFYSECAADIFRNWLDPTDAVGRLPDGDRFMVLIEPGKRQPTDEALDGLVNLTTGPPSFIDGDRADAYVYTFAD